MRTLKDKGNANDSMTIYDVREFGEECYKEYLKKFEEDGTLFWQYGANAIKEIFNLKEADD